MSGFTPTIYHETLWAAVQASTEVIPRHHAIEVEGLRNAFEPMSYETSQSRIIPLSSDLRKGKKSVLHVTIYRMASGRYEVTAYAA